MDRLIPTREIHGDGKGRIALGDCLAVDKTFSDYTAMVDMAYLDIPHNLSTEYSFTQKVGDSGWRGSADSRFDIKYKYETKLNFDAFIKTTLSNIKKLLRDDGCIYVHADFRTSGIVRSALDSVFGRSSFVNEIIWSYNAGGSTKNHFSRKHDNIFLYKKGKTFYFNPDPIGTPRGSQHSNHLKRNVDDNGRVYYSMNSGGREYRYYEDGKIYPGDVWSDIPTLLQRDNERIGYDTQKPKALLERMILSSSRPGGFVLDAACGSGALAGVAAENGRNILCMDTNPVAINQARRFSVSNSGNFTLNLDGMELGYRPIHSFTYADNKVTLGRFLSGDIEKYRVHSLLAQDDIAVDYWAVGHLLCDSFIVQNSTMRTTENPELKRTLPLTNAEGVPMVHVVDVFGKSHFIAL